MQAVLFDANGVLYYRSPTRHALANFLQEHKLQLPPQEVLWQAKVNLRAQHSNAHRDDVYDAMLHACGINNPSLYAAGRRALATDASSITLYPEVRETLHKLQRRGFKIGVVTNSSATTADKLRWLHDVGLHVQWDAFVNSQEVGVRKPDPRIYQMALEQCGTQASNTLFVGHDADDLIGAHVVGCTTVAIGQDAATHATYAVRDIRALLTLLPLQRAQ